MLVLLVVLVAVSGHLANAAEPGEKLPPKLRNGFVVAEDPSWSVRCFLRSDSPITHFRDGRAGLRCWTLWATQAWCSISTSLRREPMVSTLRTAAKRRAVARGPDR